MTEVQEAKIRLCGVYHYLYSIVREVEESDNPRQVIFANYSHIGDVINTFDGDPDLAKFIAEVGYNAKFMMMFRDVSDTIQQFNREVEL